MAVLRYTFPDGRDFSAQELQGKQIRIESVPPEGQTPPVGYAMMIFADNMMVNNVLKMELAIEPCSIVEAKLTLYHGTDVEKKPVTEEVTLRDHIEMSFSAIVSEVQ